MQNVLPKVLIISVVAVSAVVFPANSFASQLSLIFPIPTVTIPPHPNAISIKNVSTASQTVKVQINSNGDGETSVHTSSVTASPTATPSPTPVTATNNLTTPSSLSSLREAILRRLTPSPTVKTTVTPTPTKTITPTPTTRPTAGPTTAIASPTPTTPVSFPTGTVTVRDYIMNAINNYRRSRGLSAVQISDETCSFAKIRAKEISTSFNHNGFNNRIANKTIPYKSWTLITENIAMTSNYKDVVNMWINSSGHAANMQKDTPFVCVENYGNYYAYEGMRP